MRLVLLAAPWRVTAVKRLQVRPKTLVAGHARTLKTSQRGLKRPVRQHDIRAVSRLRTLNQKDWLRAKRTRFAARVRFHKRIDVNDAYTVEPSNNV